MFVAGCPTLGGPGFDVYCAAERVTDVAARLFAAGALDIDRRCLGHAAHRSRPCRCSASTWTTDTIPLEAGARSRAISQTKGCYVGQEVIIRVLHRGGGRVARRLVSWIASRSRRRTRPRRWPERAVRGRRQGHRPGDQRALVAGAAAGWSASATCTATIAEPGTKLAVGVDRRSRPRRRPPRSPLVAMPTAADSLRSRAADRAAVVVAAAIVERGRPLADGAPPQGTHPRRAVGVPGRQVRVRARRSKRAWCGAGSRSSASTTASAACARRPRTTTASSSSSCTSTTRADRSCRRRLRPRARAGACAGVAACRASRAVQLDDGREDDAGLAAPAVRRRTGYDAQPRGHRARPHSGLARRAHRRPEIHQRLVEVEDVAVRQHRARRPPTGAACIACAFAIAAADEHPEEHARDVGVDDRGALAEREAHDRAGGVGADALEATQRRLVGRQPAVVALDRLARDRLQAPRPDVVAERAPRLAPRPLRRRRRQRVERRVLLEPLRGTSAARDRPASAAASPRRRGCGTGRRSSATAASGRSCDTRRGGAVANHRRRAGTGGCSVVARRGTSDSLAGRAG